jgi:hypothetical protein
VLNLPDKKVVISGSDFLDQGALDFGQHAVEQRDSGGSRMPWDAVEAVVPFAGEPVGQGPLAFIEDADAEVPGGVKIPDDAGVVAEADENEGRVERDSGEGVDGKPVGGAGSILDAGDGNAGSESGAGSLEFFGTDAKLA